MQNSNSPILDLLIYFYDLTIVFLTFITIIILAIIISLYKNVITNRFLSKGQNLETLWTLIPILILLIIALPSIKILYLIDTTLHPKLSLKAIGHQWYWTYEYTEFKRIEFDSFIITTSSLKISEFRLLDVDNRCILPINIQIRIITTSTDVIHSWAVPSLGVKIDSTPGRLNQSSLRMFRPGLFYGQCSEICGTNHRFIPIVIESTSPPFFIKWILSFPPSKF